MAEQPDVSVGVAVVGLIVVGVKLIVVTPMFRYEGVRDDMAERCMRSECHPTDVGSIPTVVSFLFITQRAWYVAVQSTK